MALLPKNQGQMILANHSRGDLLNAARKKKGLRVAVTKRLKHFVPPEKIVIQFPKRDFVIESESRPQILIGQKFARDRPELAGEKIGVLFLNCQTRSHFVAAILLQLFMTGSQRLHQMKTFDASAASFSCFRSRMAII